MFRTIERINNAPYEFLIVYKIIVIYFPYSNLRFDSISFIHFILRPSCTNKMYDVREWKKKKNRKKDEEKSEFWAKICSDLTI